MFCQYCGQQLDENANFCNACGARVAQAPAMQEPVAPEVQEPITEETVVQPTEQPPVYDNPGMPAPPIAEAKTAWWWLGFVEPVIGLILFLVLKNKLPAVSRKVGKGALVGGIIAVALSMTLSFFTGFLEGFSNAFDDPFGGDYAYGDYYDDWYDDSDLYDYLLTDSKKL